jgi:hypothetical protein
LSDRAAEEEEEEVEEERTSHCHRSVGERSLFFFPRTRMQIISSMLA